MNVVGRVHGQFVYSRRVRVLAALAARLVPHGARVLDVGTGDGQIAAALAANRPDVSIEGLDVLVRPNTALPVTRFDGRTIPRAAASVDVVTLFDVLHHADDPAALLAEASRVTRGCVIIKDHVAAGRLSRAILMLMDEVGNRRHGVALPHHYLTASQWSRLIERLRLTPASWEVGGLGLYPWPASAVFGRRLHVLARLDVRAGEMPG
jgi:ubiquinone/menaquinone biosynthesis C-methylase UbiE